MPRCRVTTWPSCTRLSRPICRTARRACWPPGRRSCPSSGGRGLSPSINSWLNCRRAGRRKPSQTSRAASHPKESQAMLTQQQIDFFNENGFLRVEQVYSPDEIAQLSTDLSYMMDIFAFWQGGWRGAWRKEYMEAEEDAKAVLVHIHELQHFSAAWMRAITSPVLADAIGALLPSDSVEVHHSTLHAKAPGAGTPFPMHQDHPFYPHADGRYLDALIHV